MIVKLLVDANDMKPNPAISQKLGPLGINLGKVIQEVNKATSSFKGIKVPVVLDINPKTKEFHVEVSTPPVAGLLKKEAAVDKASGDHKKIKVGNLALEQVIAITQTKYTSMLANDFKSAVKSVLGSCLSLGLLVESRNPREIIREIDEGKYDEMIDKRVCQASEEKKLQLDKFFKDIKAKQDELLKKEAEAEAAKEAAKATAQPATTEAGKAAKEAAAPAAKTAEKKEVKAAEKKK